MCGSKTLMLLYHRIYVQYFQHLLVASKPWSCNLHLLKTKETSGTSSYIWYYSTALTCYVFPITDQMLEILTRYRVNHQKSVFWIHRDASCMLDLNHLWAYCNTFTLCWALSLKHKCETCQASGSEQKPEETTGCVTPLSPGRWTWGELESWSCFRQILGPKKEENIVCVCVETVLILLHSLKKIPKTQIVNEITTKTCICCSLSHFPREYFHLNMTNNNI